MGFKDICLITRTEKGTQQLGTLLGKHLQDGDCIALIGELGTGKTCLVKGIATGLDVPRATCVRSPTFVLLHTYRGRYTLFHVDLYRFADSSEIEDLGYREIFYGQGVTVVEWADKIPTYLPGEHLKIYLNHGDEETRKICLVPSGSRYESILKILYEELSSRNATINLLPQTQS
jgi:tRNA threonylcarbamoyladenosine biosynthesis protein TsaE